MFDVVLRTGFFKPAAKDVRAELSALGIDHVIDLPVELPAPPTLIQDLLASPSSHVLFVDDAVTCTSGDLKRLLRAAQVHPDADVLCIDSPVARKILGLLRAVSGDMVSATAIGAMHLVPWCALVNKRILAEIDFAQCEGSITGLLLGVESRADIILAAGTRAEELDLESWVVDILSCEHERIASAIANLGVDMGTMHPQFRITSRGRYVAVEHGAPAAGYSQFSVICPVFKARFLEDTVKSVLGQTYDNLEFLVLVDGPPEQEEIAIREVLDRYAGDARLRVTYSENLGTGRARARLAELATGEYLISIDDDDMLVPGTLEQFARAIEAHGDTPPAALRGGIEIFGFADRYLPPRPRLLVDDIPCDYFEANQPWCLHVPTLRAHGGLAGDPDLRHCGEDADYFLRLDSEPDLDVLLIDEPLYLRRLSAHNQTLSFTQIEFHAHLINICRNYAPARFRFEGSRFEDNHPFVRQSTRYTDTQTQREIITGTRYFDYTTTVKSTGAIIDLELTALCNADCTFCPRENLGRENKYLPMEIVRRLAEQLQHDGIARKVVLCGIGEPTLHPQVEEIVQILTAAGAIVCMTNNGTRMDTGRFTRLVEAGLKEVNFSVNAATDETRQLVMKQKHFDRVKQNVRDALALRDKAFPHVEVHLSFVLCPQNQHEVHDFVREWRDCSANHLWIHPVNNRAKLLTTEYGEFDATEIARRYKGDPRVVVDLWDHGFAPESAKVCTIAQATQFVDADGDVLLCALDHERKNILGNIQSADLVQLQTRKLDLYRHGHFDEFCEGCTYCPRTHKNLAALH